MVTALPTVIDNRGLALLSVQLLLEMIIQETYEYDQELLFSAREYSRPFYHLKVADHVAEPYQTIFSHISAEVERIAPSIHDILMRSSHDRTCMELMGFWSRCTEMIRNYITEGHYAADYLPLLTQVRKGVKLAEQEIEQLRRSRKELLTVWHSISHTYATSQHPGSPVMSCFRAKLLRGQLFKPREAL